MRAQVVSALIDLGPASLAAFDLKCGLMLPPPHLPAIQRTDLARTLQVPYPRLPKSESHCSSTSTSDLTGHPPHSFLSHLFILSHVPSSTPRSRRIAPLRLDSAQSFPRRALNTHPGAISTYRSSALFWKSRSQSFTAKQRRHLVLAGRKLGFPCESRGEP